ncbi:MAG: hypothetical protein Q8N74_05595 [Sulfuricella sp.]|nr:hypothetical protein [Sulfuricella sp.]
MIKLEKLYDRLSADERVNLTIAAMARNDYTEAGTLIDTCPEKTYRAHDAAFIWRLECLSKIADLHAIEMRDAIIRQVWTMARFAINDDQTEKWFEQIRQVSGVIKGKQAAWRDFCEGIGVDGDEVLAAYSLTLKQEILEPIPTSTEDVEPNEDARKASLNNYTSFWEVVEDRLGN